MAVVSISRQFGAGGRTLGQRVARRLGYRFVDRDVIDPTYGGDPEDDPGFEPERYRSFLTRTIEDLAVKDEAVIIGRGSNLILKEYPEVVRVLLIGQPEDRISFLMENYNLSEDAARRAIGFEDDRRQRLYNLFEVADPDKPWHYQVVVNTSQTPLKYTEDLICSLVGSVVDAYARPIWD